MSITLPIQYPVFQSRKEEAARGEAIINSYHNIPALHHTIHSCVIKIWLSLWSWCCPLINDVRCRLAWWLACPGKRQLILCLFAPPVAKRSVNCGVHNSFAVYPAAAHFSSNVAPPANECDIHTRSQRGVRVGPLMWNSIQLSPL